MNQRYRKNAHKIDLIRCCIMGKRATACGRTIIKLDDTRQSLQWIIFDHYITEFMTKLKQSPILVISEMLRPSIMITIELLAHTELVCIIETYINSFSIYVDKMLSKIKYIIESDPIYDAWVGDTLHLDLKMIETIVHEVFDPHLHLMCKEFPPTLKDEIILVGTELQARPGGCIYEDARKHFLGLTSKA